MKIEILGTPFNGFGTAPNIENPADGLRKLVEKLLFHQLDIQVGRCVVVRNP